MTRARMEALLARYAPKIRNRFRAVLQKVKDRWTVAQLEAALEGGSLGTVLDDIEQAAASLAAQVNGVSVAVGREVAETLSTQLDKLVSYDETNMRAVDAMRANRMQLVQGLVSDQREAFTNVLSDGIARGLNPRQQAVALRDSLGLTPGQEKWVRNYRRKLEEGGLASLDNKLRDARYDGAVRTAAAGGKQLTPAQIDRMVGRYTERAIKYRAEVIARTEALRSAHVGSEDSYRQAIESGHLEAGRLQCKWHAGAAPRTRDWHASMNGQLQPFGVPFVSGHGSQLRHPGDPDAPASETAQCRCAKSVRVLPAGRVAVSSTSAAAAP
jgi:hypothetical protein